VNTDRITGGIQEIKKQLGMYSLVISIANSNMLILLTELPMKKKIITNLCQEMCQ
jgi:hypothetical protein